MGLRDRGVEIKTPEQIDGDASRRVWWWAGPSSCCAARCAPGSPPRELDAIAEDHIRSSGATPSFLGYHGFPGSICTSVNDEVVHGIPGDRVLADGDLVSIDCGAIVDGWHGDAAISVAIGDVPAEVTDLMRVTEDAMWAGIAAARLGGRVTDISHAVEQHVRAQGDYGIVEEYTGHGIGSAMHQPPNVPNYGRPGRGPKLVRGLALAVEPMITLGTRETSVLEDDWTVVTDDGRWAAHYEHTFTLTPDGRLGAHRARRRRGAPDRPRGAFRRTVGWAPSSWTACYHPRSRRTACGHRSLGLVGHRRCDHRCPARRRRSSSVVGRTNPRCARSASPWPSTSAWPWSSASASGYFAGHQYGAEFFAGWLTEYSLSIDNLFIFIVIMGKLAVPRQYQQSALMVGIVIALDPARHLHLRRRGGDPPVQLGLLHLRRSSSSTRRSTCAREAGDDDEDGGYDEPRVVALGAQAVPGHRRLPRRQAVRDRERQAPGHADADRHPSASA